MKVRLDLCVTPCFCQQLCHEGGRSRCWTSNVLKHSWRPCMTCRYLPVWFSVSSAKQMLWSRPLPCLYKELEESCWLLAPHFLQRRLLEKFVYYARNCHLCGQICTGHIDFTANNFWWLWQWDACSQDRILLWNCWYMKMYFVLVHGYSTIKQIVMLWIMEKLSFWIGIYIFPF